MSAFLDPSTNHWKLGCFFRYKVWRDVRWPPHFNQPLDDWNVSSVTDMSFMFRSDQWDVSSVTKLFKVHPINQSLTGMSLPLPI